MIQDVTHIRELKTHSHQASTSHPLQGLPSFSMPESQNNFKLCPRDEIKSPPHTHKKDVSMDLDQDQIIQEQLIWLVAKSKFASSGHV